MHDPSRKAVCAIRTDHYRTIVRGAIDAADNNSGIKVLDVVDLLRGEDLEFRLLR
jgi:hypothetical protein